MSLPILIIMATGALVIYAFLLYPFVLLLLSKMSARKSHDTTFHPRVSFVIAAYNEVKHIRAKIENVLASQYPTARLEIIVVSDGSTDGTDDVVKEFVGRVKLIRTSGRVGKQLALNEGVRASTGEILFFSDVGPRFDPTALERLTRHFADPDVGAVSPEVRVGHVLSSLPSGARTSEKDNGEGSYMSWLHSIRYLEGLVSSSIGCGGALYAMRRDCFEPFGANVCNDFASALDVVRHHRRAIVDLSIVGTMLPARDYGIEFHRKIRTFVGGLETLRSARAMLFDLSSPIFCWQLWSHKIFRALLPPALIASLAASIAGALQGNALLGILAIVGSVAVLIGGAGVLFPRISYAHAPLRAASFALISILAGVIGWAQFLSGRKYALWQPTDRSNGEVAAVQNRRAS